MLALVLLFARPFLKPSGAMANADASKRVVLKWPLRAELLAGLPPPSHQIIGKSTRYDVFMTEATARR